MCMGDVMIVLHITVCVTFVSIAIIYLADCMLT